jgi:peroxiredoxin
MKILAILIGILLMTSIVNGQPKIRDNHFTSYTDTLIVNTEKFKGYGIFQDEGAGAIEFNDTTKRYDYPVVFPKGITDIKLAWQPIDWKPLGFNNLKKSKSDYLSTFLKNNFPHKIDTINIPSIKDNSICIMAGKKGNERVFVVDENNNKNFQDDSIRLSHKMDWKTTSKLINCKYNIYNGKAMVEDSSWVNIGLGQQDDLLFFVSHHLESTFSIRNQTYTIGVIEGNSGFCFDKPILALIAQNGIKRDTLKESELLKKGEYLKLKDTYYQFDHVSNDGKHITLIKENDFKSKIGTQKGMLAPNFNCKAMDGDSIRFKDYEGKLLLIVNVSACWSPESSYKCYKELSEAYGKNIEILCIDRSPVFLNNSIKELKLTGKFIDANENKMIEAYRPEFCSRTCFLINPVGRIVDKFEIFDWKSKMEQLFRNSN